MKIKNTQKSNKRTVNEVPVGGVFTVKGSSLFFMKARNERWVNLQTGDSDGIGTYGVNSNLEVTYHPDAELDPGKPE